jgi:hypothetical protein
VKTEAHHPRRSTVCGPPLSDLRASLRVQMERKGIRTRDFTLQGCTYHELSRDHNTLFKGADYNRDPPLRHRESLPDEKNNPTNRGGIEAFRDLQTLIRLRPRSRATCSTMSTSIISRFMR